MSANNNWKSVKLSKLGVFSKGAGITKAELVDIGVPAIRYGELYTLHHIKVKKPNSFASPEAVKHSRYITKGDIIFAGSGETIDEIGKSAVYLGDEDCLAGGDTIILSPKGVDPLFLSYYLNSPLARRELRRLGQGQSVVHIYKRDLENLEVEIPGVDEQKRAVTILGVWDEYLEKLDKKIELKKSIKKGLMQNLLTGKIRLSGFTDEWSSVELGDIAEVSMGQSPLSESYNTNGEGHILIQGNADMKAGKTIERVWTTSPTKVAPERSLIMTVRAPVGKIAFSASEVCIGRGVCAITGGYTRLLYYYLEHMNNLWSRYIQGSTFESVNGSDIRGLKLLVPSRNEADAICNVLDTASKELEQLSLLRNLANKQRDYLLSNLISGKIRTPENLTMPAKEVQYA